MVCNAPQICNPLAVATVFAGCRAEAVVGLPKAVIDKQTLINGSFNWTAQAAVHSKGCLHNTLMLRRVEATKGNQEDAIIFRISDPTFTRSVLDL